jgi:hypothetical protein
MYILINKNIAKNKFIYFYISWFISLQKKKHKLNYQELIKLIKSNKLIIIYFLINLINKECLLKNTTVLKINIYIAHSELS